MKLAKEHIEELLERFFDGQTTETEEQLLADYFRDADAVPEEWQVYKEMFDSFKTDAYDFTEDEFDAMLVPADYRKPIFVRLLPWASVACVASIVVLFVWHPWMKNPSSKTPSIAQVNPAREDSEDVNEVEKPLVAEERTKETPVTKPNTPALFTKAKPTTQTTSPKEITTSELLETISLLVDVGSENITITSLPDNEGFAVRTVSYGGESNSYMLRRCAESSSLELKSQVINF